MPRPHAATRTPIDATPGVVLLVSCILLSACGPSLQPRADSAEHMPASVGEQRGFFEALLGLCGQAFAGTAIHVPETDDAFTGRRLVMHVSSCSDSEIRIPFHVGDDRSRTWVLRRVGSGLELKHIHRHADGTESTNTNYGGTTSARGTPHRQEFPADAVSVAAVAGRATQWWFLEHNPGRHFAYGLFREASGMHYRIEFDLTAPVPTPPAAW